MDARQRWTYAAVSGLAFGVAFGVFFVLSGGASVVAGVSGGLVGGAVFGVLLSRMADRSVRRLTEGVREGLTAQQLSLVVKASVRGPIPQEPELVAAAAEVARRRLEQVRRRRPVDLVARAVLVVLFCVLGELVNPIWWLVAGLFVLAVLLDAHQFGKLRQRAAVLSGVSAALDGDPQSWPT